MFRKILEDWRDIGWPEMMAQWDRITPGPAYRQNPMQKRDPKRPTVQTKQPPDPDDYATKSDFPNRDYQRKPRPQSADDQIDFGPDDPVGSGAIK